MGNHCGVHIYYGDYGDYPARASAEEDRREEDEIKKILKGGSEESEEEEYVYSTEESFDKKWGKGRKKRSPVRTLPPGSPWKWMCPEPHQPPTDQDVNCIMSQFN